MKAKFYINLVRNEKGKIDSGKSTIHMSMDECEIRKDYLIGIFRDRYNFEILKVYESNQVSEKKLTPRINL